MSFQHGALARFVLLYAALFSAFGLVSPFLPPFLAERGLRPEQLGMVLGAGTAVRLLFGPFAGRLADRFHTFRAELAIFAILAASAALAYFAFVAGRRRKPVSGRRARTAGSARRRIDARSFGYRPGGEIC